VSDWNATIIEEFRTNEGRVGGRFEGRGLLLLHTVGRKSGVERVNPLAYHPDGDRFVIIASKGGAPTNPDWYYNLLANPRVTVELGTETFEVDAVELTGEERDLLWKQIVETMPGFGAYQKNTARIIPLVALTRVG
jgi:deazaflavin-dependent oxidoreductase (nitroreductase family)